MAHCFLVETIILSRIVISPYAAELRCGTDFNNVLPPYHICEQRKTKINRTQMGLLITTMFDRGEWIFGFIIRNDKL